MQVWHVEGNAILTGSQLNQIYCKGRRNSSIPCGHPAITGTPLLPTPRLITDIPLFYGVLDPLDRSQTGALSRAVLSVITYRKYNYSIIILVKFFEACILSLAVIQFVTGNGD